MSEQLPREYEPSNDVRAIMKLRDDFNMKGDSYMDMLFVLQDYVEQQLGIKERESLRYIMALEDRGFLPSEELYDVDPEDAIDKHRLAVYTCYMPLYQLTHTSDEFESWIRYALQIVVPDGGRHSEEVCLMDPPRERALDESCYMSEQCPVKHVQLDVIFGLCGIDMNTTDYVLDDAKACRNAQLLISAAQEYGIITGNQKAAAERAYLRRYKLEFPKPDLSQ